MILALTTGKIFRYALLPGLGDRFRTLIGNGFDTLAYNMALVYRAVNILPNNHPYTQSGNVGKYGVFQVLTEASSHLVFDKKNIDKVLIFFLLLIGIVLLSFQFILLLGSIMMGSASAQIPASYSGFITTPNPDTDIAFQLLSQVFGIPGMFAPSLTTPTTFHAAMHSLFQYYSLGILVIAAIILAYFVFAVLAETAQTGTPFGKRFNHVWAPIRLVVAIGLLVPISYGLNSAQWITLYAAKFGSGFATNGWVEFNRVRINANADYLGGLAESDELIATPNVPRLRELASFMMIAKGCKYAYENETSGLSFPITIDAYLVKSYDGGAAEVISDYDSALTFYNNGNISIVFGEQNTAYTDHPGNVYPYCGELTLDVTHITDDGGRLINTAYFDLVRSMWLTNFNGMRIFAEQYIDRVVEPSGTYFLPTAQNRDDIIEAAESRIESAIRAGVIQQQSEYTADAVTVYSEQGWAGAGIWYNEIAQQNGNLISSATNVPYTRRYPEVMEYYRYKNLQGNESSSRDEFEASLRNGRGVPPAVYMDSKIHEGLKDIHEYWADNEEGSTDNVFIDVINLIFGTEGLFDMCANADIHPMAQLSALGKGLIESSIRNVGLALGGYVLSATLPVGAAAAGAASSFLFTIAGITILIGFILFYLVPFLPFLYFFFAVGGWVKGLFEAMVGLPLWALAHLRIDGQGLPGDAAINGYYLIFEIFIRPILIVFGLLAAITVFGAMVKVLNDIFYLATSNLAGFESATSAGAGGGGAAAPTGCTTSSGSNPVGSAEWIRGPIDEFFFTVVYAILVYMIGMSTFKLIDMIPNNIMRWMGTGVNTYNDQAGEPAEGLMQKVAVGGTMISGQIQGALGQAGSAFSSATQGVRERIVPVQPPPAGSTPP
ncbi:MAG: DotA/TraY family protein [Alphaproteobacteria bacterium]|nr:DotA/TraY family protein [Alphaproteobacteria bacterium]